MNRRRGSPPLRPLPLAVLGLALLMAAGCGDNGGISAGGSVTATSFSGFPMAPGGAPVPQFLDEVLLITLTGPIDNAIFGGFVPVQGTNDPRVFAGKIGANGATVLYHAYAQQNPARQAIQVIDDASGIPFPGVVGRSTTNPRVLVFDPRVPAGNPFGENPIAGFDASRQYDVFIPADGGLRIMGRSVNGFGAPPPVVPPPFSPSPGPSTLFATGVSFVPDNTAPNVVEITTQSLDAMGATSATPIPHDDVLIVEFTEPMDVSTRSPIGNVIVRNLSVTTSDQPQGVIVPMTVTTDLEQRTFFLAPNPSFGAGPFDIEVTVGNPDPAKTLTDLAGNALGSPVTVTFTTIAAPGQPTASSILETFADTTNRDGSFVPRYNAADWDANDSDALIGLQLDGAPDATNPGTGPGARTQVMITPLGAGSPPLVSYFSPFDDNQNNNLGPTVNPQGGSHLQLLYNVGGTFPELPFGLADSIELFEWAPSIGGPFSATYDGFTMRMGATAASGVSAFTPEQLTVLHDANFTFDNPQNEFLMPGSHPHGFNPDADESPVVVVPPQPYTIVGAPAVFAPFPLLVLPFDFDHARTEPNIVGTQVNPNLIIDINIDAGSPPTNNFWTGTNIISPVPMRRLLGQPGALAAFTADAAIHHGRITIVKKNSSAQTIFLDSGSSSVTWASLDLSPGLSMRPPGTAITVRVQGSDSAPIPSGETPFLTYVSRNGVVDPSALAALTGKRFIRVRFELESSTTDNVAAVIDDVLIGLVR